MLNWASTHTIKVSALLKRSSMYILSEYQNDSPKVLANVSLVRFTT
jgi:hypothetical protein